MDDASTMLAELVGKRQAFESSEQEAYLNLVRTSDRLSSDFAVLFKTHGLSEPQYNVLRILRGNGSAMPVQKVASQMIERRPDVTRLIDRLCDAGFVTRRRCTEDRRVVWIELTRSGRRILKELDQPVTALHASQLGHLSKRDLATLCRLLIKAARPEGSTA